MSHTELVKAQCIATLSRSPWFSVSNLRTEQPTHTCSHILFNDQDNVWSFGYIEIIYKHTTPRVLLEFNAILRSSPVTAEVIGVLTTSWSNPA